MITRDFINYIWHLIQIFRTLEQKRDLLPTKLFEIKIQFVYFMNLS